ncbi:unnamed protein product [Parnassius apollo]|uniref:(apollo) hypothetical protein n=1 Tax=Parnassius apollo TaxID=110799 RepID=A0A8S3W7D3_PARAO|nr:unnamed protein product [Parnassius apollo]
MRLSVPAEERLAVTLRNIGFAVIHLHQHPYYLLRNKCPLRCRRSLECPCLGQGIKMPHALSDKDLLTGAKCES